MANLDTATIVLRPQGARQQAEQLLSGHYDPDIEHVTGASSEAMDAVHTFASNAGLTIQESDAGARRVVVSGPADKLRSALEKIPNEIAPFVMAVLGLDKTPVARPHD